MTGWYALVLNLLAVHRLTRLATKDTVTQPVRERMIRRAYWGRDGNRMPTVNDWPTAWQDQAEDDGPAAPKMAVLLICRWCSSWYIGVTVAVLTWAVWDVWQWPALALALSTGGTLLARLEASD